MINTGTVQTAQTLIVMLLLVGSKVSAQDTRLSGRIVDFASESRIPGARVDLLDARDRRAGLATSDSTGSFVFGKIRSGSYRLRVEALGYRVVVTPALQVDGGEPAQVIVRLAVDAVPLAPLEVLARATPQHRHSGLAAFFERSQQRRGGTFILRDEIEARNPQKVSDLLATVGSFTVLSTAGLLVNDRCNGGPTVYLDGQRISQLIPGRRGAGTAPTESFSSVNFVSPRELEGLEIYAGAATVPSEYSGSTAACGVIVMWTRRD